MNICKLSGDQWIVLEHIRTLEVEYKPVALALVTWSNGSRTLYRDKNAIALLEAWAEIRDTPDELDVTP